MKGAERIVAERTRQIQDEGWDDNHDDGHTNGELVRAAICYAANSLGVEVREVHSSNKFSNEGLYPWKSDWDSDENKISRHDDIRSLEIAGALLAAEIDRLIRAKEDQLTLGDLKPGELFTATEGDVCVKTSWMEAGDVICVSLDDGVKVGYSFIEPVERVRRR
jgi:hypothetical protein